jgi:hypothetical protein
MRQKKLTIIWSSLAQRLQFVANRVTMEASLVTAGDPLPSSHGGLLRTQGACNELQRSLLVEQKRLAW